MLGMLAKKELVDEKVFARQEVEVIIAAGVYTLLLRISHFAARARIVLRRPQHLTLSLQPPRTRHNRVTASHIQCVHWMQVCCESVD